MKTDLSFEQETTKKLLSKLDFEFFLKQNIEKENYSQPEIDSIYTSYTATKKILQAKAKENNRQFNYYNEGQVRQMFTGQLLPAFFELNDNRGHTIIDFPGVGENWAYFSLWQKYYKRKLTSEKVWDIIVKGGSLLAILLSIEKVWELIK